MSICSELMCGQCCITRRGRPGETEGVEYAKPLGPAIQLRVVNSRANPEPLYLSHRIQNPSLCIYSQMWYRGCIQLACVILTITFLGSRRSYVYRRSYHFSWGIQTGSEFLPSKTVDTSLAVESNWVFHTDSA